MQQTTIVQSIPDEDTIYPYLPGEICVGKYRYSACCSPLELILILTNLRVLIRWKQRIFFCSSRSTYQQIFIDKITLMNEFPQRNRRRDMIYLMCSIILATAGVIVSALALSDYKALQAIIITVSLLPIIGQISLLVILCCFKVKFVQFTGDFGSVNFVFDKNSARELESRLPELIYQARHKRIHANPTNNAFNATTYPFTVSPVSPPAYQTTDEKKNYSPMQEKKLPYDTEDNNQQTTTHRDRRKKGYRSDNFTRIDTDDKSKRNIPSKNRYDDKTTSSDF
ncbi:unnamed protein product [Didymodactylos carnosus]|uniref:Uncharacterized protein n=1 Tax=Didymodactylos carnosus TaxID=1234261 RepID=A0A814IHY9_9BILA|nr:unnamed protein product [Didymodactylos carnosus]CAF1173709.1 unnamed protein product [Didymodactylos carnosus]CAF3794343.1 unnamed protein product [Didymodactylos carnosus]CAF3984955.1 unnamed protein product [Didymodactylos carnosus]